ncbi:MAG: hypothetical protein EZS28_031747, partial [Streblomastix strix]
EKEDDEESESEEEEDEKQGKVQQIQRIDYEDVCYVFCVFELEVKFVLDEVVNIAPALVDRTILIQINKQ